MLALEYLFTKPEGIASLTLASSPVCMPQWVDEANRLREELPADVQATLLKHEEAETTHSEEYEAAMMQFYNRHVCRLDPLPDSVMRSFEFLGQNAEVYNTMNGPSEFHVIGTIKDWDVRDCLGEINVPTLITSGRYDEATPLIAETALQGIPNSEWVLFEESSHMAHIEEQERYMQVLNNFISQHEE
jgi:proline-specific peptidase